MGFKLGVREAVVSRKHGTVQASCFHKTLYFYNVNSLRRTKATQQQVSRAATVGQFCPLFLLLLGVEQPALAQVPACFSKCMLLYLPRPLVTPPQRG